jgi:hypothetical protein
MHDDFIKSYLNSSSGKKSETKKIFRKIFWNKIFVITFRIV